MSVVLQVNIWCHTGQGSVSRTKQKSSGQHEGQQVRCALKMRPQSKDSWSQHSQEGEQENANYRRENPNTYIKLYINTYSKRNTEYWQKFRWISKQLTKNKEMLSYLQRFPNLSMRNPAMMTTTAFLGKQDKTHFKADK